MNTNAMLDATVASIESVAIVTFSKGRRHHLEESLPRMLAQMWHNEEFWVVVVDYGCPDGSADWCLEYLASQDKHCRSKLKIVRVLDAPGELNRSHARNIGGKFAVEQLAVDAVAFLDADAMIEPGWTANAAGVMDDAGTAIVTPRWSELTDRHQKGVGCCLVRASVFCRVRGYDELMRGWGWEDSDFHNRCTATGGCGLSDGRLIQIRRHPLRERVRFHRLKDKSQSKADNIARTKARDAAGEVVNPDGYGIANVVISSLL